ncbi:hypothetical protein QR685DRAFT_573864 [Neurospora intermedia]|uniref:Ecp2 effector protein domain-containing protein n=1 Tax=Neurospora intermedia TaxID=5142 RepID=A0ABR3DA29_NEUIN
MKLTHLSPLAVWAIITNLTTAAPTTTTTTTTSSNPNDPSKFTPEQAISTFHNSRHKSSSISKREVRCDIIPGDFRMWTSHGRVVIPEAGTNLCIRGTGKLRAWASGNGDQRTTKGAIAKAATRILDTCSKDGWVVGTDSVEGTSISLVFSK